MAARPEGILRGEDVGKPGGVFGLSRGLQKSWGPDRVIDTPIAETAILGAAVGAAMEGLRPIAEIMFGDFLFVALDQIINQAANVRYVSNGRSSAPLVVRTQQGVPPGSSAQTDRKSTRLNSSHYSESRMPSSAVNTQNN